MESNNKNKTYMVLYNYNDRDYSVVKLFYSLENAYNYICLQEDKELNGYKKCKMVVLNEPKKYNEYTADTDIISVCYIKTGKYLHLDIYNLSYTSSYIIVPMEIS